MGRKNMEMKKRMPKSVKETLEKIAQEKLSDCYTADELRSKSHICQPHQHNKWCADCQHFAKEYPVYRIDWGWHFIYWFIFACWLVGDYFIVRDITRFPIEKPYPVYITRLDPRISDKLKDCQESWENDQIMKKFLRMKIKQLEMP